MNIFTRKFKREEITKLTTFLKGLDACDVKIPYSSIALKNKDFAATLYDSGKFVLQGKNISLILGSLCEFMNIENTLANDETLQDTIISVEHIGTDESGKGDYFGPLVVSGVLGNDENISKFKEKGIKDCKKLTDEQVLKFAGFIKANSVHSTVIIGNAKYNELYSKFKNLNKLLAWGHARAIENILEKQYCKTVLSDKFGDEKLIQNALMDKGKTVELIQRHKAEEDIAVAAASILARAEFLNSIDKLSRRYEINLPKGASDKVIHVAKDFVNKYGKEKLKMVAKLHFKTTSTLHL